MTDLPKIGSPATSALENIGITALEQLTHYTKSEIMQLHGMGPKAMAILEDKLKDSGLKFKHTSA